MAGCLLSPASSLHAHAWQWLVRACLQAVFQQGLAHVPEALRQDNPGDVPAVLAAWTAGEAVGPPFYSHQWSQRVVLPP